MYVLYIIWMAIPILFLEFELGLVHIHILGVWFARYFHGCDIIRACFVKDIKQNY